MIFKFIDVTVEIRNQKLGHTTENVIFALMCRMDLKLAVPSARAEFLSTKEIWPVEDHYVAQYLTF